jgi:hypothetical protein
MPQVEMYLRVLQDQVKKWWTSEHVCSEPFPVLWVWKYRVMQKNCRPKSFHWRRWARMSNVWRLFKRLWVQVNLNAGGTAPDGSWDQHGAERVKWCIWCVIWVGLAQSLQKFLPFPMNMREVNVINLGLDCGYRPKKRPKTASQYCRLIFIQ